MAQIIAGDTNAEPDEKTIEILTRDYRDAFPKRPPHTFLWERNRVVDRENIDYILLKRGRGVRALGRAHKPNRPSRAEKRSERWKER